MLYTESWVVSADIQMKHNKYLYKPSISPPVLNSPTHTGQHFPCGTCVTRQDSGSSGHCGDFSSQKLRPLMQLHCSHSFFHQVEPFAHTSPSSTQESLSSGNITFICSVSYKEQCNAYVDTAFVCTVSYCAVVHLTLKASNTIHTARYTMLSSTPYILRCWYIQQLLCTFHTPTFDPISFGLPDSKIQNTGRSSCLESR